MASTKRNTRSDKPSKRKPSEDRRRKWFGYWDERTASLHMAGKHDRELEAARRAREEHPDRLRALCLETDALAALGRVGELRILLDESTALLQDGVWTPGLVMVSAGMELRAHHESDAAGEVLRQAIEWLSSRPPKETATEGHRWMSYLALYAAETWDEAHKVLWDLYHAYPESVLYRGRLGVLAARLGDVAEALKVSRWLANVEGKALFGLPNEIRARIAAVLGERDRAVALLSEAIGEGQGYSRWRHMDPDLEAVRDAPELEKLFKPNA